MAEPPFARAGGLRDKDWAPPARRPSARAMPGRCAVYLTADARRLSVCDGSEQGSLPAAWRWLSLRVLDAQRPRGLLPEATQLFIAGLVFVHPLDRPPVPRPGLGVVAELPVGHRQEEP